jgi:hypothetical protein
VSKQYGKVSIPNDITIPFAGGSNGKVIGNASLVIRMGNSTAHYMDEDIGAYVISTSIDYSNYTNSSNAEYFHLESSLFIDRYDGLLLGERESYMQSSEFDNKKAYWNSSYNAKLTGSSFNLLPSTIDIVTLYEISLAVIITLATASAVILYFRKILKGRQYKN